MVMRKMIRAVFGLLLLVVIFLALVPGSIGRIVPSDTQQHSLAFLIMPIVACAGWPKISALRLWLLFALFGGAIELCQQWMAIGRTAQWQDWFTNVIAATFAIAAVMFVRKLLRLR